MRRVLGIGVVLVLIAAAVWALISLRNDDDDQYLVRAYFDNAGFLVNGEDVRVAGARVGSVEGVDVAMPGEAVTEDGGEDPGKAVVVMNITDPGFQDFLSDASCLIRPQSLLGEKYVECEPTQARAPGSSPPPPLEEIPDGDPGEGQYRLPLENNGKAVDLDLINNITREPENDRFRLILNDLGAGLAARGDDLAAVIRRANPALQETNELLAQLADQNDELAQLAADSDAILAPLSRERARLAGFIRNATIAGEASAERRDDIVAGFQRFPQALTELESTMVELRRFAEAGQPVAQNLRVAAPAFTEATRALKPFSQAGTGALLSLGDAAEQAGPDLAAADPVIRDLRTLGQATTPGAKNLKRVFATLRKTNGIGNFMDFIYNTGQVFNGYDELGHYLRGQIQITNCVTYDVRPVFGSGCEAQWADPSTFAGTPSVQPEDITALGAAMANLEDFNGNGEIDDADLEQATEETPGAEAETSGEEDADGTADPDAASQSGDEESGKSGSFGSASGDLFKFLMEDSQ